MKNLQGAVRGAADSIVTTEQTAESPDCSCVGLTCRNTTKLQTALEGLWLVSLYGRRLEPQVKKKGFQFGTHLKKIISEVYDYFPV